MEQFQIILQEPYMTGNDIPLSFSYEDFLTQFNQAYLNENNDSISLLLEQYPDYLERYADIREAICPENDERGLRYPILADIPHYTKRRILNLLEYLLGNSFRAKEYWDKLENDIACYSYYNYISYDTDKGYKPEALWSILFLSEPELQTRLELLRIGSFDELVYRAVEYFELDENKYD